RVRIEGLRLAGDQTRLYGADRTIVDLADRRHLGGGASEEKLVGAVEVAPGEVRLPHLDAFGPEEVDDRRPGDAVEDSGGDRRREHDSIAGQEQVLAGAFRDVAVGVEHERVVVAGGHGLLLAQHAVQVLFAYRRGGDEALTAD